MDIIKFPECNITFAEDQPEYQPLPALKLQTKQGEVISCWKLSFKEKIKILFTGKMWLSIYTFNNPLQPILMSVDKPFKMKE